MLNSSSRDALRSGLAENTPVGAFPFQLVVEGLLMQLLPLQTGCITNDRNHCGLVD